MNDTRKTLLFINGNLDAGGVERSLLSILNNLDYSRYDVDLLLLDDDKELITELPKTIRLFSQQSTFIYGPFFRILIQNLLQFRWKNLLVRLVLSVSQRFGDKWLRFLRPLYGLRKHYDCAIALRFGLSGKVLSSSINADKKVFWWHYGNVQPNLQENREIQNLVKDTDIVITVSDAIKDRLIQVFSFKEENVYVVPNIIDIQAIYHAAGTISPFNDFSGITLVTVGRFAPEKHFEDIPDIAKGLLVKGVPPFKWYIIGNGTRFDAVQNKVSSYKLHNHIQLLGKLQNPFPYIKFADILVHPSHVEAQCLTILEAMALKTPCVVTKTIIPQDSAQSGRFCLLSEPTIEDQVDCVFKMITCLSAQQEMVNDAFEMIQSNHSPQMIIPRLEWILFHDRL
jgi:glycosyltransferase involved in cell wall biosynthesis